MRVALVYRNVNLGGSLERFTVLRARGLVRLGAEVHLYCNPRTRTVEIPGVAFHDVCPAVTSRARVGSAVERATFARRATRMLRRDRGRCEIVDVSGTSAWEHDVVTVHAVAQAEQERWVTTAGTAYRAARQRAAVAPLLRPDVGVVRSIERLQLRPGRYRRLIVPTSQVAEDLMVFRSVPRDRIDVLPYPIDLERMAPSGPGDRAALRLPEGVPLLLFVGSDFERKGLDDALDALAGLDRPAELVIVGEGPSERYEEAARRLGVAGRVHFVGGTEAPERYFHAADVFVLPSRRDVWAATLLEAMAAGVPVVTTRAAGAAPEVERADAGIVLRDGSPRALREAIVALLDDPGRRRQLGEHGRRAAVRFGPDAHAEAVLRTYELALARPRAA